VMKPPNLHVNLKLIFDTMDLIETESSVVSPSKSTFKKASKPTMDTTVETGSTHIRSSARNLSGNKTVKNNECMIKEFSINSENSAGATSLM